MLYMRFTQEVMGALDRQEAALRNDQDADDIDWRQIYRSVKSVLPDVALMSAWDWSVEGIKITYARHVWKTYERRNVWKFLKGAPRTLACQVLASV
jgi:hypothetical protein